MDTCQLCNQPMGDEESVFEDSPVHERCYNAESKRSQKEDGPGPLRSRPPKYMLDPSEYSRYGY